MQFKYTYRVRESDLDAYGHVNNAAYVTIYEEARWDIISERGCGLEEVQKTKVGPIILSLNVVFRKEMMVREVIEVVTDVIGFERKICNIKQKMLNNKGEVLSEAEFKIAIFDMQTRKIVLPDEKWLYALGVEGG